MNDGLVVFVLFFGLAVLEAARSRGLPAAVPWLIVGVLFAILGRERRASRDAKHPAA